MKTYAVHSIFLTVQGEGAHAGRRAVFLRFAGCNVWSGRPEDRERDAAKGCCAAWCDTEFIGTHPDRGGGRGSADEIADRCVAAWALPIPATRDPYGEAALVVVTGGEPSLQLDAALVLALQVRGFQVHVETNGSHPLPGNVDWVTLSPKPPMPVVIKRVHEVKVVYPAVDPLPWADFAQLRFVSPMDPPPVLAPIEAVVPRAVRRDEITRAALRFVMANPGWRLSLQTHKVLGVP